MARSSKAQNPIGIYVRDGVLRLGFVILYLICIYWSTEAVLKYLDEPAVTNIQYKNGDNEMGIPFPLVTICDQIGDQNHEYASIMIEHCGVKMTTECLLPTWVGDGYCDDESNTAECGYDGGDCCIPEPLMWYFVVCECKSGDEIQYAGESFLEMVKACLERSLEKNQTLDLNQLMLKVKELSKGDFYEAVLFQDSIPVEDWEEIQDQVWSSVFHPQYGYCQTFNLRKVERYSHLETDKSYRVLFNIHKEPPPYSELVGAEPYDRKKMNAFLHEENELPDHTYLKIGIQGVQNYDDIPAFRMEKHVMSQPQPPLERNPCSQEKYYTCINKVLSNSVVNMYGCMVPLLDNGLSQNLSVCPQVSKVVFCESKTNSLHLYNPHAKMEQFCE